MEKIYLNVFKTSYWVASLFFFMSLISGVMISQHYKYQTVHKAYILNAACFIGFLLLGVNILLFAVKYHIKYKELTKD